MKPVFFLLLAVATWFPHLGEGGNAPWRVLREAQPELAEESFLQGIEQNKNGQSLLNYGRFLKSSGDKKRAVHYLRQALTALEKEVGVDSPLLLPLLLELAQIHGQPIPLLERAQRLSTSHHGENNPWLVVILEKKSRHAATVQQAIVWQEEAIARRQEEGGAEVASLIPMLSRLADLWQKAGQHEKAAVYLERALALATTHPGPFHVLRLRLLQQLATYYQTGKKYSDAITYLVPALALAETIRDSQHYTLVPLLNQLALCYREMGQPAEATPLLTRALFLTEKQLGSLHPETARLVATMAGNLRLAGNTAQAILLYQRALAVLQQEGEPVERAPLQIALAKAMVDHGMALPAEPIFRQGLQGLVKELGGKSNQVEEERQAYAALLARIDSFLPFADMWQNRELIGEIQRRLVYVGLQGGPADGKPHPTTRKAIKEIQHRLGVRNNPSTQRNNLISLLRLLPPIPPEGCL